ncbi:hypothetical protein ACTFIW_001860 [Dictyostelium discoideum]
MTSLINKYDNKCSIYKDLDIRLVVCDGCIVLDHTGHKFDFINAENSKEIFEEFKNNHIQNLDNQIDINNELLNESNNLFKSLKLINQTISNTSAKKKKKKKIS